MRRDNSAKAEELIYDADGIARAYLAKAPRDSIFTLDGERVALLSGEELHWHDGRHIGWFVRGVMYDGDGKRIGFTRVTCPSLTVEDPRHDVRESNGASTSAFFMPSRLQPPLAIETETSEMSLTQFLAEGSA